MNIEHVLYSHFCTASRPIFFSAQTPYLPEYSYPKIPKISDPNLLTRLKLQPHYSQSSRENATHPAAHPHKLVTWQCPPPPRSIMGTCPGSIIQTNVPFVITSNSIQLFIYIDIYYSISLEIIQEAIKKTRKNTNTVTRKAFI